MHWSGILLVGGVAALAGGCARPFMTVDDAVYVAGRPMILAAHVETEPLLGVRNGVERVLVEFLLDDRLVGATLTDGEGRAEFHRVFTEDVRFERVTARARLDTQRLSASKPCYTWSPDPSIVLVDIDHTVLDPDYDDLIFDFIDEDSQPLPGARATLVELARDYQLIYFTARPRFMLEKTRRWLVDHGYPDAPLLTAPSVSDTIDQRRYKRRRIALLRQCWPNLVIGLGDKGSDAAAYTANGLLALILRGEDEDVRPARDVLVLDDWSAVRAYFAAHKKLLSSPRLLRHYLDDKNSSLPRPASRPADSAAAAPAD